jgi:tetratricopeptide (TPR) repeat protein
MWVSIRYLIGRSAHSAAEELAKQVLRKAQKYQITDIALLIIPYLSRRYSLSKGDRAKVEEMEALRLKMLETWNAESLASQYYADLNLTYSTSKALHPQIHELAGKYIEELKKYENKVPSYLFHSFYYMIGVYQWLSIADYPRTIATCERAFEYLENLPFQHKTGKLYFLFQHITSSLQLRRYEDANSRIKECLESVDRKSPVWIRVQELNLLKSFHTGEYQEGFTVLYRTYSHPQFNFVAGNVRERWLLYQAYLHYLLESGRIKDTRGHREKRKSHFRVNRFLNEVPLFSKDKRGMNIPILIIQTLFLIHRKKYDKAILRIEALEKYATRHLRKNDTFRSNCFIKMMLVAPKQGFHRKAVVRHAAKFIEKLREAPLEKARQPNEIEIIPYENLWEIFLEQLDFKHHFQR